MVPPLHPSLLGEAMQEQQQTGEVISLLTHISSYSLSVCLQAVYLIGSQSCSSFPILSAAV